ncbi:MAG: hypothetical protein ACK5XN_25645 [Bacteroidota bacterium]|jgi:hypothetical protein
MYTSYTQDELIKNIKYGLVKNYVLVRGYDEEKARQLALKISTAIDSKESIYWLDGSPNTDIYPSIEYIKLPPRLVATSMGIRFNNEGLILPQAEPIVIVIYGFGNLKNEEKEFYMNQLCKREEFDYSPQNYVHPNSIVLICLSEDEELPKHSYKLFVTLVSD